MRRHPFLALFALGCLGVLSLLPVSIPAIARMPLPAASPPRPVIVLLSLLQPTILVAVAVGAAAMLVVVALDVAFRPFMGEAWQRFEQPQDMASLVMALVMGMLYGGITEEILLRSLEAAMIAHATGHVVLFVVKLGTR